MLEYLPNLTYLQDWCLSSVFKEISHPLRLTDVQIEFAEDDCDGLDVIANKCPHLQVLNVNLSKFRGAHDLVLTRDFSHLTTLQITGAPRDFQSSFDSFFSHFPQLDELIFEDPLTQDIKSPQRVRRDLFSRFLKRERF